MKMRKQESEVMECQRTGWCRIYKTRVGDIWKVIVGTITRTAGLGRTQGMNLPDTMITAIEDCGFFESIPLWAVSLIDRRRTAHAAHRHFFFEILRLGLHGGRDYTFSLRDLFHFRSFAACHRHCGCPYRNGLVVPWGTDF